MGVDSILVPWVVSGVVLIVVALKLAALVGAAELASRTLGGSSLALMGHWTRALGEAPTGPGGIVAAGPLAGQLGGAGAALTLTQAGETFTLRVEGRRPESFGTDVAPISRVVEGGAKVTALAECAERGTLVLSLETPEGYRLVRTFRMGRSPRAMEEEVLVGTPDRDLVTVERFSLVRR